MFFNLQALAPRSQPPWHVDINMVVSPTRYKVMHDTMSCHLYLIIIIILVILVRLKLICNHYAILFWNLVVKQPFLINLNFSQVFLLIVYVSIFTDCKLHKKVIVCMLILRCFNYVTILCGCIVAHSKSAEGSNNTSRKMLIDFKYTYFMVCSVFNFNFALFRVSINFSLLYNILGLLVLSWRTILSLFLFLLVSLYLPTSGLLQSMSHQCYWAITLLSFLINSLIKWLK